MVILSELKCGWRRKVGLVVGRSKSRSRRAGLTVGRSKSRSRSRSEGAHVVCEVD
jgi:hypothetical protein